MDNDKSILEKIGDAVKDLAKVATDAANDVMKVDAPALKADERALAYMPLAAEGLVSDPLMMPPVAVAPARKRKRTAKKAKSKTANKAVGKSGRKTAKKSASKKPAKVGGKPANKQAGQEDS